MFFLLVHLTHLNYNPILINHINKKSYKKRYSLSISAVPSAYLQTFLLCFKHLSTSKLVNHKGRFGTDRLNQIKKITASPVK